jgi:hypothetical protein
MIWYWLAGRNKNQLLKGIFMADTIYILGAGTDVHFGLPIMSSVFKDLHAFSIGPGKDLHNVLRSKVPNMRFQLKSYAENEGENVAAKLLGTHSHLLDVIAAALKDKHPDKSSENIVGVTDMLDSLIAVREANAPKATTAKAFANLAGLAVDESSDPIIDPQHMIFNPLARHAMQTVLVSALETIPGLTKPEQEAFQMVAASLMNFEETLGSFFRGFFTGVISEQKKYFYLSWMFWVYIRLMAVAGVDKRPGSFYETLSAVSNGGDTITFNYTDFFCDKTRPTFGYFHGDLNAYIHFEDRHYDTGDKHFNKITSVATAVQFFNGTTVDYKPDTLAVPLPALIPPISMKPLICAEYLEKWYRCSELIKAAKVIFVVGYSFAAVDEHFNDLLRKQNPKAQIIVINPFPDGVCQNLRRLGFRPDLATPSIIASFPCLSYGRFRVTKAFAEQVQPDDLIQLIP